MIAVAKLVCSLFALLLATTTINNNNNVMAFHSSFVMTKNVIIICNNRAFIPNQCHYSQPTQFSSSKLLSLRHQKCRYMAANSENDNEIEKINSDEAKVPSNNDKTKQLTWWQTWQAKIFPSSNNEKEDGLTTRQRLAKMGLSVVLSYGWVSNTSYMIILSISWFLFSKQTGLSPLAPGQWKPFLAVYTGFWVFNNFLRPLRVAGAIAASRYFDRVIETVQQKLKVSKAVAIGFTVFLANIVGTITLMVMGVSIASVLSGVPIFQK